MGRGTGGIGNDGALKCGHIVIGEKTVGFGQVEVPGEIFGYFLGGSTCGLTTCERRASAGRTGEGK